MCDNRDMESYHANEARLKMRDILTAVERGEHIEIKRYDTPTAVVVPREWHDEAAAALTAKKKKPSRNWADGWAFASRDGDGNLILRHEPTGGLYKVLPVEEC